MDRIRQELEERYSSESPQDEEAIESLLQLIEELTNALEPAQPRAEFREWLGDELVAVVRERPELTIDPRTENRRRALLLGASVGLFLPLLGVVAYLLRIRLGSRPQHAGCNKSKQYLSAVTGAASRSQARSCSRASDFSG